MNGQENEGSNAEKQKQTNIYVVKCKITRAKTKKTNTLKENRIQEKQRSKSILPVFFVEVWLLAALAGMPFVVQEIASVWLFFVGGVWVSYSYDGFPL